MKDDTTKALLIAEAAGLHRAVSEYTEEVLAAAKSAADMRKAYTAPDDPAVEPWPPMRTGGGA